MRRSNGEFSVAANAQRRDVDNRISLHKYYRIADNLLKQILSPFSSTKKKMTKFLHNPHLNTLNLRTFSSFLSKPSIPIQLTSSSSLSLPISKNPQIYLHNSLKPYKFLQFFSNSQRNFSIQAFESSSSSEIEEKVSTDVNGSLKKEKEDEYPSGEFEFKKIQGWRGFVVKIRMLFAFPWQRVKKGSVLSMKLRGEISEQLKSRFSSELSLPQICENFIKAAYDPRISGVYLQIEPLNCGWGKVEEIRRHILDFKKSVMFETTA